MSSGLILAARSKAASAARMSPWLVAMLDFINHPSKKPPSICNAASTNFSADAKSPRMSFNRDIARSAGVDFGVKLMASLKNVSAAP
jgi:hypothetical protein